MYASNLGEPFLRARGRLYTTLTDGNDLDVVISIIRVYIVLLYPKLLLWHIWLSSVTARCNSHRIASLCCCTRVVCTIGRTAARCASVRNPPLHLYIFRASEYRGWGEEAGPPGETANENHARHIDDSVKRGQNCVTTGPQAI